MPRRPRRTRPRRAASSGDAPLRGGHVRVEPGPSGSGADGWVVRSVSGTAAAKDYRCPGCDQVIPAGTPHVVAWPASEPEGPGQHAAQRSCGVDQSGEHADRGARERRHWHTGCWRRARR